MHANFLALVVVPVLKRHHKFRGSHGEKISNFLSWKFRKSSR